jgi:hypothetical protein
MNNGEKLKSTSRSIDQYSKLDISAQAILLSRLSLALTVEGRGLRPPWLPRNDAVDALSALNEMQHTISGHLVSLLKRSKDRYPDDVFINVLFDHARASGLEKTLSKIMAHLLAAK